MKYSTNFCFFKEVLLNYNGISAQLDNLAMKLILRALIIIQFSELICFGFLFRYISNHDKEMFQNSIISQDIYKRRNQENAYSGFKQFLLFVHRFSYLLLFFLIRFWGQKYFGRPFTICFTELMPLTNIVEFAINSTLQLAAITELRRKVFSMFKK